MVERILAVVDGRPVLLSEVAVFQKVRGEAERQALDGLIDEQLMYREAARLPQAALTADEEQRAFESLQARIPSTSADDEEQLRRLSRRQAAILKYVDFRFRPQVRVSEEAVRAAYEAQKRPDGPGFEEAAPALRAALAEDDLTRRIEEWVKELRRSAEIRYNTGGVDEHEETAEDTDRHLRCWVPVWESWPPRKVDRRGRHPAPGPRPPPRTFGRCLRRRRRRPSCRVRGRRPRLPWLRFGRKTKRRSSTRSASCWDGRRPSSPSPPRRREQVTKGFADSLAGATPQFPLETYGPQIRSLVEARQARRADVEKEKGRAYVEQAAKESGAVRADSGLLFVEKAKGSGPTPRPTDKVKVNYHGTLVDGKVFDSTQGRGPAEFLLNGVIPCWTEGLQKLAVGGKAKLVCPSSIAYGDAGRPGIPGGATLVFDVELLAITPAAAVSPAASAAPRPAAPRPRSSPAMSASPKARPSATPARPSPSPG